MAAYAQRDCDPLTQTYVVDPEPISNDIAPAFVREGRFLTVATPMPLGDDDIRALKEADQR